MITAAIIAVVIITTYLYSTRTFKYWSEKGIKHDSPLPIFGNNLKGYFFRRSMTQMADELYWKYPNEKVVGFYRSTCPELLIRDPDIAKKILTTDFSTFHERGYKTQKTKSEPLMQNLFFVDGDNWKLLRQRMTPAFSTGKLKAMFPLIVERAERLQARVLESAACNKSLDAKELMARYTTDFIGACGFGIDTDTLSKENSAFRQLGQSIFKTHTKNFFIPFLKELFPKFFKDFSIMKHLEKDFKELLHEIMKKRNYKPCGRNDFIDLMLELKEKGTIVGNSLTRLQADGTPELVTLEFDNDMIVAQVFIFFAAGFETSSSATSFTLHQLAFHQDVQKKVQEEVDRVLYKYKNKLCYEAVKEMKYLEWTFKEGLRMFPSPGFLLRCCTKPYTFSELDLSIDENIRVLIPIQAIQNNSIYFENPQEFRPERFHPDKFGLLNKYVYLPFGEGPRACVGERLGMMQSLAGLAAVLSSFTVCPAPETLRNPIVDPMAPVVQSIKSLPLLFRPRKTKSDHL